MENPDSDTPVLSALTLQALGEFRAEQALQLDCFEQLNSSHDQDPAWNQAKALSMDMFPEDWNASQFWVGQSTHCTSHSIVPDPVVTKYDTASATLLAQQLLNGMTSDTCIAIISTPSVFVQLKKLLRKLEEEKQPARVSLFEWDERFRVFDEFIPYDFEKPEKLDPSLKGVFDHILYDPPYHSVDCQTKG
ncbi:hypothetical protein A1O3_08983 [Capronia epimyces CBS 606.96]|uniref:Protein-lysine N-methyltransferase EFM5 n=1 Tax=Capronia epimyces CBS 606.96 TaxID=1182542 RepID=W9Y5V5_9EURO|nr:uncharacterized protein A1O3_08983 [Capronia epimyces CBS 606.96]EXJ77824.1 hypothetical protein A1O3_08983 [Capronia epimyces CBS 606.96]